jgi:uncharacterized protein YhfF
MTNTPQFSFSFGKTPEIANDRLSRVIAGVKTATSEPASSYVAVDDPERPKVGKRFIVLDGEGRPGAVIEIIQIETVRYDKVDESHAKAEGYSSLAEWANVHQSDYLRDGAIAPEMLVICQTFQLVEVYQNKDG